MRETMAEIHEHVDGRTPQALQNKQTRAQNAWRNWLKAGGDDNVDDVAKHATTTTTTRATGFLK